MIRMCENQQEHRISTQVKLTDASIADTINGREQMGVGQRYGLVISLAGILGGVFAGIFGGAIAGSIVGSVLGGGGLVSLVALFLTRNEDESG